VAGIRIRRNDTMHPGKKSEDLLKALDEAIARGVADIDAGRKEPAAKVFDRLEAKYRAMAAAKERDSG
jgi:uncharacterized lipoprotein YehR (DUF1307 family)